MVQPWLSRVLHSETTTFSVPTETSRSGSVRTFSDWQIEQSAIMLQECCRSATDNIMAGNLLMVNSKVEERCLITGKAPKSTMYQFGYPFGSSFEFNTVEGKEPHTIRREMILKAHPEVQQLMKKSLFGYVTYPALAIGILTTQLYCAYYLADADWWMVFLAAYVIGGTVNHTQFVLMHDLTHFAAYQSILLNKFWAVVVNIATGVPSAISFGKHHADHHRYLGVRGKDPDIATYISHKQAQVNSIGRNPLKKLLFGTFLFLPYGLRPLIVHGKQPCMFQLINIGCAMGLDLGVFLLWGGKGLAYILLSTMFSMSVLHPCTLHILAEHYEYTTGLDTFDYLGPINIPNLNMGYHIEHHDFPNVPWFNLPKLRKVASQYYEQYPVHTSYLQMLHRFIFDEGIALSTRTVRIQP